MNKRFGECESSVLIGKLGLKTNFFALSLSKVVLYSGIQRSLSLTETLIPPLPPPPLPNIRFEVESIMVIQRKWSHCLLEGQDVPLHNRNRSKDFAESDLPDAHLLPQRT